MGYALLEAVAVDRLAEVVTAGDILRLLGRGGQADVGDAGKVIQDLAPGRIVRRAAAVALVDDHQIEEIGRKRLVDVLRFFAAGDRLVQRQVDREQLVDLPFAVCRSAWSSPGRRA